MVRGLCTDATSYKFLLFPVAGMSTTHNKNASPATAVVAAVEASVDMFYRAPLWLPNSHVQTIVPALFARLPAVAYRRERWDTPDGDFIELDWLVPEPQARSEAASSSTPLFVLFHG